MTNFNSRSDKQDLSFKSEIKCTTELLPNTKLIKDMRRGDVYSFDEIYKKYNKKIYSFSLKFLKNKEDAENVVQELFLNLWRKRADLKDQYNFDSYLFTITYNMIRKHFRKLQREEKYHADYGKSIPLVDDSTNTDVEYNNLIELAEAAINHLPARQKEVYHLSMKKGLTSKEISIKLGISKRTVENHKHRAKAYLRKAFSN